MQNTRKADSKAQKSQGGATLHKKDNRSNLASSAPIPTVFAVSERTAALLSLCVELDMVVERVGETVDVCDMESYVEEFNKAIFDARRILLHKMVADNIEMNLAWTDDEEKEIKTI